MAHAGDLDAHELLERALTGAAADTKEPAAGEKEKVEDRHRHRRRGRSSRSKSRERPRDSRSRSRSRSRGERRHRRCVRFPHCFAAARVPCTVVEAYAVLTARALCLHPRVVYGRSTVVRTQAHAARARRRGRSTLRQMAVSQNTTLCLLGTTAATTADAESTRPTTRRSAYPSTCWSLVSWASLTRVTGPGNAKSAARLRFAPASLKSLTGTHALCSRTM
jgi:hypothetical protein